MTLRLNSVEDYKPLFPICLRLMLMRLIKRVTGKDN